jgi:ribosomal protein S18 acetylase RimI-like enzyme
MEEALMVEIRRIHDDEGDTVAALWDRMCREIPDGGPLTEWGKRNIARMLEVAAWHRDAFCLLAVDNGRIVGFVNGRTSTDDGLLPGVVGEVESLYVVPEAREQGISKALARAAIGWLREHGVGWTIRSLVCADNAEAIRFWESLGFEPDMVCMSLYNEE